MLQNQTLVLVAVLVLAVVAMALAAEPYPVSEVVRENPAGDIMRETCQQLLGSADPKELCKKVAIGAAKSYVCAIGKLCQLIGGQLAQTLAGGLFGR